MFSVTVKALSADAFRRYGTFASMVSPDGDVLAHGVTEFYRDLLPLPLAAPFPAASVTKISERPPFAEKWEYHTATGEAFMPLDGDAVACFIPAGRGQQPDVSMAEAFLIPQGTMVCIRPGVWHQAPFACGPCVHNLVLLPERTYANDCTVVQMAEDSFLEIKRNS